jgi:hypothetical protein
VLEPFLLGTGAPSNSDYFPFVAEEAPRARFLGQQALQLSSLALAPVPVVDLLEQRVTAPDAELPPMQYFAWSRAQRSAWALSRFAVTGLDADAPHERGPGQVARALRLCAREDVTPMQGRLALHALAAITTPFLPPERARSLWQSDLVLRCDARVGAGSWRPLYAALAARDLPATATAARAALKSASGLRIEVVRYALAAGLAAELAMGRPEAARDLASAHARLLAPPLPPYLGLLSAHLPIP